MSDNAERRLHDQLSAVGTIEPSPGLADAALLQAKQRRRKGIAAIATAGAVVLAIALAVPLSVHHTAAGPSTPPPSPQQRNVVVSYQSMSSSNPYGTLMVLDPKTGKYVESKLPSSAVRSFDLVVSPDGQHYASSDGKTVGSLSDVIKGNVDGLRRVDPGQTAGSGAAWSADASRLLIPIQGVNKHFSLSGFRIYDTGTKRLGKLVRLSSDDVDSVIWAAHDTTIVGFAGTSESVHQKVEFFDLDGRLQRTVTLPAHLDALHLISPDGRYLSTGMGLFDLRTRRTVALQLPGGQQSVAPVPLGWLDDEHYAVDWKYRSGKNVEQRLLVLSNSGKLIKSITPPLGTSALPKTGGKSTGVEFVLGYAAEYPPNSGLRL